MTYRSTDQLTVELADGVLSVTLNRRGETMQRTVQLRPE